MLLSLSPWLASVGILGVLVIALVLGFVWVRQVNVAHDPEAEIRRITLKVRHPWKALVSRWLGVD